jgi:hypothetical protein
MKMVKIEASVEASNKNYKYKSMTEQKGVHKLKKSSAYSFSVTIPKEIVEKYRWREKQKLVVKDKGHGKVEISDWRRK